MTKVGLSAEADKEWKTGLYFLYKIFERLNGISETGVICPRHKTDCSYMTFVNNIMAL